MVAAKWSKSVCSTAPPMHRRCTGSRHPHAPMVTPWTATKATKTTLKTAGAYVKLVLLNQHHTMLSMSTNYNSF